MDEERACDHCCTRQWTILAYNRFEVAQIGCWTCFSVYNVVGDEYSLINQNPKHFIFWKDLKRQWREVMSRGVSFAMKRDA